MSVVISGIAPKSPANRAGVQPGERLISINGNRVTDVLDYRFYMMEECVELVLENDYRTRKVKIRKDEYDDLGLEFKTYLMDKQRSCKNKCIFCFIDQLPKGMRKSLYFKDDDDRLSFLFGNYITLTNVSEEEIDRIIKLRISPVNISVHTTNPELRVKMMKNPHAGESLRFIDKLVQAGISINCQLVLCPGINDGPELERSLRDLSEYGPSLQSVACVPVGLSDYRDGLFSLVPYTKERAGQVIDSIERFSDEFEQEHGFRIAYPADEFFLTAQRPIPPADYYGEFSQLENGIGLIASMKDEFDRALEDLEESEKPVRLSIATGAAAQPFIAGLVDELGKKWHNLDCKVYAIKNDFFGNRITVAGLVTATDLIKQLKGRPLGDKLLLPSCMLDSGNEHFLDDITPEILSERLAVPVEFVNNDGYDFVNAVTGEQL